MSSRKKKTRKKTTRTQARSKAASRKTTARKTAAARKTGGTGRKKRSASPQESEGIVYSDVRRDALTRHLLRPR